MQSKIQRLASAIDSRLSSAEVDFNLHLLTKQQLARLLSTTPRQVELMVYRRRIPVIRLGHRTVRVSWPKVQAALAKITTAEV